MTARPPETADDRAVTVEVIGLPGSGKSTLVRAIAEADERVVATTFASRSKKTIAYTRSARSLSPILLRGPAARAIARRDFGRMVRLDAIPTHGGAAIGVPARVRIFDQGPVFLLYRLAPDLRGERRHVAVNGWVNRMLGRWASALDLVVVLDAPDEVLLDRVQVRSKSHPLQDVPRETGRLALHRHRQRYERILSDLRTRERFDILRLDTAAASVTTSTTRIQDAIARATLEEA